MLITCNLFIYRLLYLKNIFTFARCLAGMAELVDALDLGSSAKRRGGSSPFARTEQAADLLYWEELAVAFE